MRDTLIRWLAGASQVGPDASGGVPITQSGQVPPGRRNPLAWVTMTG